MYQPFSWIKDSKQILKLSIVHCSSGHLIIFDCFFLKFRKILWLVGLNLRNKLLAQTLKTISSREIWYLRGPRHVIKARNYTYKEQLSLAQYHMLNEAITSDRSECGWCVPHYFNIVHILGTPRSNLIRFPGVTLNIFFLECLVILHN